MLTHQGYDPSYRKRNLKYYRVDSLILGNRFELQFVCIMIEIPYYMEVTIWYNLFLNYVAVILLYSPDFQIYLGLLYRLHYQVNSEQFHKKHLSYKIYSVKWLINIFLICKANQHITLQCKLQLYHFTVHSFSCSAIS